MMVRVAALAALLLWPSLVPAASDAPPTPIDTKLEDPLGQDPTRPRPEVLLRYEFRNEPGRPPDKSNDFIIEGITRLPVNEHWAGRLRLEMPLVLTDVPPSDDANDAWRFGSGDLLTEAAAIHYPDDRWAVAAGGQIIYPTASRNLGGERIWGLGVGGAVRAMLPEISPDSFVISQLVYVWDAAGDRDRAHVSELRLQPTLQWAPTPTLFFELFPAGDIVVNLTDTARRGRLFFPFNALAGILLTPKVVTTLEVGVPIVKDYPLYDFKLQATVGYFFD